MDAFFRKIYDSNVMRKNILNWFEFDPQASLLIFGDPGEVVRKYLKGKVAKVHETPEQGALYDYVLCFDGGVEAGFDSLSESLLMQVKSLLKPEGKGIFALFNQFGLRSFSGVVDEKSGKAFAFLEGHDGKAMMPGYSRKEAQNRLEKAGFGNLKFYYPMPDHLFPEAIYSDKFLPQPGDLRGASPSYIDGGIATFKENLVFDRACEKGEFPEFANSFLIIAG